MKLRVRRNSLRLRLSRSEVAQFASSGSVEETVEFGSAEPSLTYRLCMTPDSETILAIFANNRIDVLVPKVDAENWINSEMVGIDAAQQLSDSKTLLILVEKDFACLVQRENEDEKDAFPNPRATAPGDEI